ncbi:MAG: sugar ABC transporter permease [Ruminococcaceae bacterium]|nr:sugar ABC transporter permease [Oscillospiraceae bacterium]
MRRKSISYAKWGYIFIAPFFIVYAIFQLWPLVITIYNSFFQFYDDGIVVAGPNFVGLDNYTAFITGELGGASVWILVGNTIIMWIMGFVPQIIVSLLFAYWFTNKRLDLKCTSVFKSIIYMPNLIMASAFSLLIFSLFANTPTSFGNSILMGLNITNTKFDFLGDPWAARGLVALMNFMMWFGNTTILLMAAMMGVDESLVEAADIDGCSPNQIFWKITMPLIRPILVYVMITSLVGGLQMFDVPQVLSRGLGTPSVPGNPYVCKTLIMFLNDNITRTKNYGAAGAISVILFIVCAAFSMLVYYFFTDRNLGGAKSFEGKDKKSKKKKEA